MALDAVAIVVALAAMIVAVTVAVAVALVAVVVAVALADLAAPLAGVELSIFICLALGRTRLVHAPASVAVAAVV